AQNQKHHHQQRRRSEQPVERPADETPDSNTRDHLGCKLQGLAVRRAPRLAFSLRRCRVLSLGLRKLLLKFVEPLTNAFSITAATGHISNISNSFSDRFSSDDSTLQSSKSR